MDFRIQLIAALIVASIMTIIIDRIKRKKYVREGKTTKYLMPKLFICIMVPIMSIPVILSGMFSAIEKVLLIGLGIIGGLAYYYGITSFEKLVKKAFNRSSRGRD